MRKLLSLLIATVVIGYSGLTYLAGNNFSKQLSQLETLVATEPNLKLIEHSQTTSFLTSSGQITLEVDLSEVERGLKLNINAPWQATHLAGWVNFASQLKISATDGYETLDLNQLLGLPSFDVTGTAGLKKLTYQQQINQLNQQLNSLNLQLKDWLIEGEIHYSGKETGQLSLAQLSLGDSGYPVFNLEKLLVEFNQKGKFPWQKAYWLAQAEQINFTDSSQQFSLKDGRLTLDYQLNEKDFNLTQELSFTQLLLDNLTVEAAHLATQLSQINSQALGKLLIAVKEQQVNKTTPPNNAELEELFIQLLADSPKLNLQQFTFTLNQPFAMNPSAKGWLEFNGKDLPENFVQQLETANFDEDDLAQRLTLELTIANFPSLMLALLGLPSEAVEANKDTLFIQLNQGQLFINDQQIF